MMDLNALKVQRALLKRQLKVCSKTLKAQAWAPGFMSLETHINTFLRFFILPGTETKAPAQESGRSWR
jgi:hypothetical protein